MKDVAPQGMHNDVGHPGKNKFLWLATIVSNAIIGCNGASYQLKVCKSVPNVYAESYFLL